MPATRKKTWMDQLEEWIDAANLQFAQSHGGYPGEVRQVAGHIVVAECHDDEVSLCVYTPARCRQWYRDIKKLMKEQPEESLFCHVNDSAPNSR